MTTIKGTTIKIYTINAEFVYRDKRLMESIVIFSERRLLSEIVRIEVVK